MEYLTNTEELMMKCIWNYGKEMPFLRMGEELKDKFHKEYKRTSIRTYLFRLEDKGYIKVEKRGRKAYINALIDETTYKTEKAASMQGSLNSNLLSTSMYSFRMNTGQLKCFNLC